MEIIGMRNVMVLFDVCISLGDNNVTFDKFIIAIIYIGL